MIRLRALKPFLYNTRRLIAGDVFEAKNRDARLLVAVRKASHAPVRSEAELPPPTEEQLRKIELAKKRQEDAAMKRKEESAEQIDTEQETEITANEGGANQEGQEQTSSEGEGIETKADQDKA